MPHHEFFWTARSIQKVEDNGLTIEEVEYAVRNAYDRARSRSSHRRMYFGETPSGDEIAVPYDELDVVLIQVVTAYKVG
jgi:hypothetical protein